jgi:hypothetical protein
MLTRALLASALLAALAAGPARADYQFTFATAGGVFTNNFTINPNLGQTTVDIRVYLTQTATGSDTTGITTGPGLNQAGIQLNTSGPGIATVTGVTPNDTAHGGPFNATNTTTGTGASAFLTEGFTSPSTGLTATATNTLLPNATAGANSVYLGTFTFTAGSAGTTSTVSVVPSPGQFNFLADGTVIDSLISNSTATISVTAVPEPGTVVLSGLLATGIAGGMWRRARRVRA